MSKTYVVSIPELQKHGQSAVEAFMAAAYNDGIIDKKQYERLQNKIVMVQTEDSFITRLQKLIGFTKPADDIGSNVMWIVYTKDEN
jgi:uncharacterized membrane protein YebE (DUF533 family)